MLKQVLACDGAYTSVLLGLVIDHCQHRVARVAVFPLRARRKLAAGLLLQQFHDSCVENLRNFVFRSVGILLHQDVFVVGQSRSVVEQVADGDGFSVGRKFGEEVGEVVVVVQFAVVYEKHDAGRCELLGERC